MNDNSHILWSIECHIKDLAEMWRGFEIIKTMLNQKFYTDDVKWVCDTTMASIDHKIKQLEGTRAFWDLPPIKNEEVSNGEDES